MNNNELDKFFDDAVERIERSKLPAKDVYGNGPLAADHLLLKKSWFYFRGRVKAIEQEWHDILKAKDDEIKALKAEVETFKKNAEMMGDKKEELELLQESIAGSYLEELKKVEKNNYSVKSRWEEERQILNDQNISLEIKLDEARQDLEKRKKIFEHREAEFIRQIESLKGATSQLTESQVEAQKSSLDILRIKDDEIHSLDAKVELLRSDVERRDQALKDYDAQKKISDKEIEKLASDVKIMQDHLIQRGREIEHLKKTIDMLDSEKELLRANWAQEQAEWRELWDRNRQLWDDRKKQS